MERKVRKNFFENEWNNCKNMNFDFFNPKFGAMSDKNCPIIFFDIFSLLAKDCNYKIKEFYVDSKRLIISGMLKQKKNELMLRFAGDGNELVVARISFIEQRCGKMAELYSILKRIQKKHKTGKIVIECVVTNEMKSWCEKNGFVRMGSCSSYVEK